MMSQDEILDFLRKNKDQIESFGVDRIGVFGSVSRGEQTQSSDIDFLVDFEEGEKSYRNFIELKRFLENELGTDVDLVTRSSVKPSMRDRIFEEVEYGKEA
jgi:predicted nucleotidyltransferase